MAPVYSCRFFLRRKEDPAGLRASTTRRIGPSKEALLPPTRPYATGGTTISGLIRYGCDSGSLLGALSGVLDAVDPLLSPRGARRPPTYSDGPNLAHYAAWGGSTAAVNSPCLASGHLATA